MLQPKTQNSSYQSRDQDRMFIPSTTYASVFGEVNVSRILFQPADPTKSEELRLAVSEILSSRRGYDPTDRDGAYIHVRRCQDRGEVPIGLLYIVAIAWLFLRMAQEGEVRQALLESGHDVRTVQRAVRYRRWHELTR